MILYQKNIDLPIFFVIKKATMQTNTAIKPAGRIVGSYFLFLLATSLFLHATFIPLQSSYRASKDIESILMAALQNIDEEETEISIENTDLTGLKAVVLNKRKQRLIAEERAANRANRAAATIANTSRFAHDDDDTDIVSLPVAYNNVFDSLNVSDYRLNVIKEAKKHLGLKYIWGGASPKGFDCSGFTSYLMAQQGVDISRSSSYQSQQGKTIELAKAKTGDLIFFSKYGKGGRVTHVAMVVDNKENGLYVIHSTRRGIVVDNLMESSYWKPKMLYAKDVLTKS